MSEARHLRRLAACARVCADRLPGRYLLVWIPAALAVFYVKLRLMQMGGYRVLARQIGLDQGGDLGLAQRLSVFRGDALLALVAIPLVLLILLMPLGPRLRAVAALLPSVAVATLLYLEISYYYVVGRFCSLGLMRDAVVWAEGNPGFTYSYSSRGILKLAAAIAAMTALATWAARADRRMGAEPPARGGRALRVTLSIAIAFAILLWLPRVTASAYHTPVLFTAIEAFVGASDAGQRDELAALAPSAVMERYREVAGAPPPRSSDRYTGAARGSDVIVYVFETGPARCVNFADDDLADFPDIRRLRERSFAALRHMTTYPYTNRAVFSLLGSWYPANAMRSFIQERPDAVLPGLLRSCLESGYATAVYTPAPSTFEEDDRMYAALGAERQRFPDPGRCPDCGALPWQKKMALDLGALELLEGDMRGWIGSDRRYCAVIMPQIGHGPWFDTSPATARASVPERGRAIMALQDRWIGALVRILEELRRLDRTVLVVTADHGVRTTREDPAFRGGRIDEYSFHVPLLVCAPGALSATVRVPWLTSHVDVAPTVLELLGISAGRAFEEGAPLWDPGIADRTSFFFADHFLGADGYHERGRFFMWNRMSDTVYAGGRLSFGSGDQLVGAEAAAVRRRLETAVALQRRVNGLATGRVRHR